MSDEQDMDDIENAVLLVLVTRRQLGTVDVDAVRTIRDKAAAILARHEAKDAAADPHEGVEAYGVSMTTFNRDGSVARHETLSDYDPRKCPARLCVMRAGHQGPHRNAFPDL